MPKIVEKPENQAIAKTISLEAWEWEELDKLALKWRTSRSKALRRIWSEWDAMQAPQPPAIPVFEVSGGKDDAALWQAVKRYFGQLGEAV